MEVPLVGGDARVGLQRLGGPMRTGMSAIRRCAAGARGYALLVAVALLVNGCPSTVVTLTMASVRSPHEMNQTIWLEPLSYNVRARGPGEGEPRGRPRTGSLAGAGTPPPLRRADSHRHSRPERTRRRRRSRGCCTSTALYRRRRPSTSSPSRSRP